MGTGGGETLPEDHTGLRISPFPPLVSCFWPRFKLLLRSKLPEHCRCLKKGGGGGRDVNQLRKEQDFEKFVRVLNGTIDLAVAVERNDAMREEVWERSGTNQLDPRNQEEN